MNSITEPWVNDETMFFMQMSSCAAARMLMPCCPGGSLRDQMDIFKDICPLPNLPLFVFVFFAYPVCKIVRCFFLKVRV